MDKNRVRMVNAPNGRRSNPSARPNVSGVLQQEGTEMPVTAPNVVSNSTRQLCSKCGLPASLHAGKKTYFQGGTCPF